MKRAAVRSAGRIAGAILLAAAAIAASGCPAMMLSGAAYSAYKYEHKKNEPVKKPAAQKSAQPSPPSDTSIE
ncbi:MAG: hypothetical protein ACREQI_16405 [Candidatus Binataceae bacterium]